MKKLTSSSRASCPVPIVMPATPPASNPFLHKVFNSHDLHLGSCVMAFEKILPLPTQVESFVLPWFGMSERNCTTHLLKMAGKALFKSTAIGEKNKYTSIKTKAGEFLSAGMNYWKKYWRNLEGNWSMWSGHLCLLMVLI